MISPPRRFNTQGFEPEEEHEALHLWDLLDELAQFALDFECAVDLLEQAERMLHRSLEPDAQWAVAVHVQRLPYVPARDAALTLYQFGRTLIHSIPDALRRCPTLSQKVDHAALREVRRRFEESFKTHELLRHAIGHAAEIFQTRKDIERHAAPTRMFGGRAFLRGNLLNRALTYTINGKEASVAITRSSVDALEKLSEGTYDAFAAVCWPESS